MRDLQVVGLSEDGRHLLLTTPARAGRAAYRIPVDADFEAALRGELRPDGADERPVMTPREIQSAVRGGATVEDVAAAAGIPQSRVERFAGPVLSERERVLEALLGVPQSGKSGRSSAPLGSAVERALKASGTVREGSVAWTAYRTEAGAWVARLTFVSRGRDRVAEWTWDPDDASVRPGTPAANDLAHVQERRRRPAAAPVPPRSPRRTPPRQPRA